MNTVYSRNDFSKAEQWMLVGEDFRVKHEIADVFFKFIKESSTLSRITATVRRDRNYVYYLDTAAQTKDDDDFVFPDGLDSIHPQ